MYPKRIFMFTIILSGILFLSACVTESPESPTAPVESEDPIPYPYPEPSEEIVRPIEPVEPYPYPNPDSEPIIVFDPYPGVDDSSLAPDPNRILITEGFVPISTDKDFNRGPAFIDSTDIILKESFPVQVELVIIGNLPTPCHNLRVVAAEPDADGLIDIEIYSVSDPEKMCIQVLEPFEAIIPLGDYAEGNYTIDINGESTLDFKLP